MTYLFRAADANDPQWAVICSDDTVYLTVKHPDKQGLEELLDCAPTPFDGSERGLRVNSRLWDMLHHGDQHAVGMMEKQIRAALKDSPQREVVICGHGLGGALGILVAAALLDHDVKVSAVLGFGVPQVVVLDSHNELWRQLHDRTTLYINAFDPLPRAPWCFRSTDGPVATAQTYDTLGMLMFVDAHFPFAQEVATRNDWGPYSGRPRRTGWLQVREGSSQWKRRFVVNHNAHLMIFDDEESTAQRSRIGLEGAALTDRVAAPAGSFGFEVTTTSGSGHSLRAGSLQEREEWTSALELATRPRSGGEVLLDNKSLTRFVVNTVVQCIGFMAFKPFRCANKQYYRCFRACFWPENTIGSQHVALKQLPIGATSFIPMQNDWRQYVEVIQRLGSEIGGQLEEGAAEEKTPRQPPSSADVGAATGNHEDPRERCMLDLEDGIRSKDISSLQGAIQRSEAFRGHHLLDSSLVEEARFQLKLQLELREALQVAASPPAAHESTSRFLLVRTSYVRGLRTGRALPEFRDIYFQGGLEVQDLNLKTLIREPQRHRHIAIVSHRWLEPGCAFDRAKTEQLQGLLANNEHIELVWIDWSSLPQGRRRGLEQKYFSTILPIVNILYSTLTVIIMVDQQYIGRFWTQLECFLALRQLSEHGLEAAPLEAQGSRCFFIETGASQGTGALAALLQGTWGPVSVQQAHERLAQKDVVVTNQSDKIQQLRKLLELDDRIRGLWSVR